MKKIYKSLFILAIIFASCKRNPDYINQSEQVYDENSPIIGTIIFSSTFINNELTQMDLFNPFKDEDLLINNYNFCESQNINDFVTCNDNNISHLENTFGTNLDFLLGNNLMTIYNPEEILFDCDTQIDKNTGFTINWNVDNNLSSDIAISLIPRLDVDGHPYSNKDTSNLMLLHSDNGSITITPNQLSNFESGDVIDIVLIRGNEKRFGNKLIRVQSVNVHVAKIN